MVVAVGETLTEPAPFSSRVMERLPGLMTALWASVETLRVEDCPMAIVVGEAVSVAVGAVTTVTVAVAISLTVPKPPLTSRV